MFNFFRVNDPIRLVGILIYVILFSVISWVFFSFPSTTPTLMWMVLGERLSEGYLLYVDVIDDTGPLSAGVFTGIHLLFGRSHLAYILLGKIFVFFQIYYWNSTLIRFRVFDENTYLPAIIMAALFHFSFDLMYLSPTLLGSTFLLLAFGQLFSHTILQKESSESTLLIGIYGGLATGFHWNFVFFLPFLVFTGLVVSNFKVRQLFLAIMGFLLPILLILVFYFWNDGLEQALQVWPIVFTYPNYGYQPSLSWLGPGAFPLLLTLIGYVISSFFRGTTINQQKQRQLILTWLLFSAGLFFLVKNNASYQLVVFLPALSYFISQFFLHFNWILLIRPAFFGLVLVLPLWTLNYWTTRTTVDTSYFLAAPDESTLPKKTGVMVLEEDPSPYLNKSLEGPFLNFHMSMSYLKQEKTLQQKAQVFQMIRRQQPKQVLDKEGLFKDLLEELPALKDFYTETNPGIYSIK
ncbi:MAG: hypothetical protein O2829_05680 [Bacteroidetes bacterium]|nr:hypothetical protein [Bacteroidota bacterium]